MPGCADDQQLDLEPGREIDDIPHRMAGDHVGSQFHLAGFGHCSCALNDPVKAMPRHAGLLAHLLDELGHVVDLLHADHVKLGVVLPGNAQGQDESPEGVLVYDQSIAAVAILSLVLQLASVPLLQLVMRM
jgi:hypothetical protein